MKISELIAEKYWISNRLAKQYIKSSKVKIDNHIVKKDFKITTNEFSMGNIELDVFKKDYNDYKIKDFLIRQTPDVVFFYKPPFMHTERIRPDDSLTLEDIVKKHFPKYDLISRLDFKTDGVVPAIKNGVEISFVKKTYLLLVNKPVRNSLITRALIDASKRKKVKAIYSDTGKKREFIPIRYYKNRTLLKVELESANRHEIRALMSESGFPILGDNLYGGEEFPRLMLRCQKVYINDESASSFHLYDFIKTAHCGEN